MSTAIEVVFYIFQKFVDLLFSKIQIVQNVYLGWVIIACIVIVIMANSILNMPKGMRFKHERSSKDE